MKKIVDKLMVYILEFLIKIYRVLANFKHTVLTAVFGYSSRCKHQPSCSQYALYQIKKDGTIRGLWLGLKRILTCW